MSNIQHLIENAMICLENKQDISEFLDDPLNKEMAETIGVGLGMFAEIAIYMRTTYIPLLLDDIIETYLQGRPWRKNGVEIE